ncbi:MAG: septum formation initiator family protein [Prevotellaceae bacterium]|nr:septum formation initiator family protein [Candidatus Minthosoma equi]
MKHPVRKVLFKVRYFVALAIFAGVITFVGDSCLINRISQQQDIARLKAEIENYNRKFNSDKQQLEALKNDVDAVKAVARERYYMKAEDEDIFIIEEDE